MVGKKIHEIAEPDRLQPWENVAKVINCDGLIAMPGLMDQHVHITGGGGEQGFASRLHDLNADEIVRAGVTTVVGVLGADGYTRSLENLYAKAKALEIQGLTTYMYSGSYAVPIITLTDCIVRDMVLVDKVIGAGEVAIADHRSSQTDYNSMIKLAADTHMASLISGKAGVVHIHVGDGKGGLGLLFELNERSDLPIEMFVPTHTNRSDALFEQAISYLAIGGNIDLTAGEKVGPAVSVAVKKLLERGADMRRVTVSSDANGSSPEGGVICIKTLFDDMVSCIKNNIPIEIAVGLVTENVANRLKLPQKGRLSPGCDGDILVCDREYNIKMLFARGTQLLDNGQVILK